MTGHFRYQGGGVSEEICPGKSPLIPLLSRQKQDVIPNAAERNEESPGLRTNWIYETIIFVSWNEIRNLQFEERDKSLLLGEVCDFAGIKM